MKSDSSVLSHICSKYRAFLWCLPILILAVKPVWAAKDAEPVPQEFQVQFDEKDPYEIVLTAEKYRQAMVDEDIEEKAWRKVYYDKAKQLYEKAFFIDPYFSYGYLSYGYMQLCAVELLKNKDYYITSAMELISRLDMDNPAANLYAGQLYCLTEDWEKANKFLDKAQELGGNSSNLYIWSGYALSAVKNDTNSQTTYQKAIDANTEAVSVNWAKKQLGKTGKPWNSPPLILSPAPRKEVQPPSAKMRLKINEFKDSTNTMGSAAQVFSRLLTTALFDAKRFNLVNTEDIQLVDAVLTGNIVRIDSKTGQFILDVQVFNPVKGDFMLAELAPVAYTLQDNLVQVDNKEVVKVAEMIQRKLPKGEGRIVNITGQNLVVSLGSEQGVQSGFTALVVGKSEKTVKDPFTGEILSRDIYLGEIVFERIDEKYSTARLLSTGRMSLRMGDFVRLK